MPGENIQDWSTTAANNGNADTSINWAEGQPRASVNNSARSMMAAHAKQRNLQNGSIVTGGSANAQTFFSGLTYTAPIPTGLRVLLKIGPSLTNTGAATLEMDGLGAVAVKDPLGADPVAGALTAGAYAEVVYNGTNWILLVNNFTAWGNALLAARAMFRANAGSQVIGINVPQTVVFSTEVIDIGALYDGSIVWTPPAGRVLLTTSLVMTTADVSGCVVTIEFWKNGATVTGLGGVFIIGASVLQGGSTVTALDVADGASTYRVVVTFDRGGGVTRGSFSGMLM